MSARDRLVNNSVLRRLMRPVIAARTRSAERRFQREAALVDRLTALFDVDPPLRVTEFNGVFSIDRRSDLFKRLVIDGRYEAELASLALKWTVPDRDVIDVGANVGFFSVLTAKALTTGRVLAVEPTPTMAKRLRTNLERNDVASKVILFEGAASDSAGSVDIHYIEGREEYSSLGSMAHPAIASTPFSTANVRAERVDDLVKQFYLAPALIKIDVEGMEHVVLGGANETLSRHRPVVISELSDPLLRKNGSSSQEIISLFNKLGYDVIDPLHPGVAPGSREYVDILCIPKERTGN